MCTFKKFLTGFFTFWSRGSISILGRLWAIRCKDWLVSGIHLLIGERRSGGAWATFWDKLSLLFFQPFPSDLPWRRSGQPWRGSSWDEHSKSIDFWSVRRSKYNFHPGLSLKASNRDWLRRQFLERRRVPPPGSLWHHRVHLGSCPEWRCHDRGGLYDHSHQKNHSPAFDSHFPFSLRWRWEYTLLKGNRDDHFFPHPSALDKNLSVSPPIPSICFWPPLSIWGDPEF